MRHSVLFRLKKIHSLPQISFIDFLSSECFNNTNISRSVINLVFSNSKSLSCMSFFASDEREIGRKRG